MFVRSTENHVYRCRHVENTISQVILTQHKYNIFIKVLRKSFYDDYAHLFY